MWEKFKDWIASSNFPWFMLGWQIADTLAYPNFFNFTMCAFWIWVLTMDL